MTACLTIAAFSWEGFGSASSEAVGQIIAWVLIAVGFFGTFLPLLPGPILIFAGAVVHRIWLGPENSIGWTGFGVLTALLLLTILVEYVASALGAKYFGATKWGMTGAIVGGIIGLFWGLPGIFLGPLIGAFSFEIAFARKDFKQGTRSTWGTLLGTAFGVVFKTFIAGAMVLWIVGDIFWW